MKIRNILYISAIMLLAGCSKDADISNSTTLSGNGEKTPLLINATLDTGKGQTRAVDGSFEDRDVLKAYVRHTIGGTLGNYTILNTDYAKKLVTIHKDGTNYISDSYWDDFSLNNNLKEDGHGLHAFYGYCYNGRLDSETPAPALTEDTGVLVWSVLQNQNSETYYKHSDLLKAPQTATVNYSHSTGQSENHGTLELAFTHAMSQITVRVNAGIGFSSQQDPLSSTVITLKNMFTTTQITGPDGSWEDVAGEGNENHKDITMYAKPCDAGATTRDFVAVVAPGTKLRVGAQLMNISDVHGNYYNVEITSDMIAVDKWATVAGDILESNYIKTKPGMNYHLDITIDKSAVQVSASLAPWSTVTATGTGAIQFTANFTDITSSSGFKNDATSAFSLFWVKHDSNHDTPAKRVNTAYTYATTSTTNNGSDWTNTPALYWPNNDNKYYFRALANYSSGSIEVASPTIPSITTTARGSAGDKETDGITTEGYILWGTTAAHSSYALGAAIPPRTGGVPMEFRVVNKCKVSFTLATADGGAAVNLTGATISVTNLYTAGNINLEDGSISGTTLNSNDAGASAAIPTQSYPIGEQYMLAQTIRNDAVVTVTLAGNAGVYKIKLNQCMASGTPITVWEGGHTYNYTIHVEKEAVKFSAAVKPWATVSGSGTATME